MYGVPKFRENFFMKYKKEVLLSVGAFLTIATVVKFVPGQMIEDVKHIENNVSAVIQEEVEVLVGYQVMFNGVELGIVADETSVEGLVSRAYENLKTELGYDPEINAEAAIIPVYEGELTLNTSDIVDGLQVELYNSLDVVLEKAYIMRIGDDFTVALESEDCVKEVLVNAQEHFIKTDVEFDIDLDINEHNSMVMTPKVLMLDPGDVSRTMSTAGTGDSEDEADVDDSEVVDSEDADTEENPDAQDEDEDTAEVIEAGTLKEVEFAEEIAIVEAFVDPKEVVDVATATDMITKENEEKKQYEIKSGDSPWQIANDHDMSLPELYAMNPELESKEKSLQVGDTIVIMVPEPELKVEVKVEVTYTESIARDTVTVRDVDTYVGRNTTVTEGEDGTLEITAVVTKLNGVEIDREIVGEERIKEPVDKVISQGAKALPVRGATGYYIYPVESYTITSYYGYRSRGFHRGVDLANDRGTPIMAIDGGRVIFAGWKSSSYGYFVEIDHGGGITSRYAHCNEVLVSVGDEVQQGQDIAKIGSTGNSTGPHLHLEILFDGVTVNPLNYLQ